MADQDKTQEVAHIDLLAQREEIIAQILQHESKAKATRADLASISASLIRLGAKIDHPTSW